MGVSEIAFVLLILRLVSLMFVVLVLRSQIRLMKMHIESELAGFRNVMLALGYVLLIGSFLPIVIDFYYSFIYKGAYGGLLVYYAISNCLSHLAASILLWNIYRIAGKEIEAGMHNSNVRISNEADRLQNISDRQDIADDRKAMDEEVQDGINTRRR